MALKQQRQLRELSQSELAALSGVSVKTIQAYEQEVKNINNASLTNLLKLSIALNCNIKNLITDQKLIELINKYERRNTKC